MVYAIADQRKKAAMQIIDPRQEIIREKIRIAPGNSTSKLLDNLWYHNEDGIYPDFQWKKILDIGGGFGWVAPILWESAAEITVVDPVFREKNHTTLYEEDIGRIERLIWSLSLWDASISPETQLLRAKNLREQRQVQQELLWWKTYDPAWKDRHIRRNDSYGEHLVGIPVDSIDVIFVDYVISKKTVDPEKFLQETHRVLKKNGHIIISDNDMFPELFSLIFQYFDFSEDTIIENRDVYFTGKGQKKKALKRKSV